MNIFVKLQPKGEVCRNTRMFRSNPCFEQSFAIQQFYDNELWNRPSALEIRFLKRNNRQMDNDNALGLDISGIFNEDSQNNYTKSFTEKFDI